MALPVLNAKTFEVKQPSTGDKLTLRPFLVAEEKVLLQVADGTPKEMSDAIKQIIRQCLQGKEDFDIDGLPSFDIEYIFLRLRSESVGSVVELKLPHKDGCERTEFKLDLTKVQIDFPEGHTNKIMLDKKVGVIMTYPNIEMLGAISDMDDPTQQSFSLIKESIQHVYTADGEMHSFAEASDEEKESFIDSMSTDQFMKMQDFFTSMPILRHTVKVPKCGTCGQPFEYTIEGLSNFF